MFEELVTGSIGDLVANYLDSPELQGFTAFPGIVSVHAGPDSPGTAYVFAHHAVGGLDGELGAHGFVRGGMGGVTQALAASARAAGTTIVTGRPVVSVLLDGTRAVGVELADGRPSELTWSSRTPIRAGRCSISSGPSISRRPSPRGCASST